MLDYGIIGFRSRLTARLSRRPLRLLGELRLKFTILDCFQGTDKRGFMLLQGFRKFLL
jgi:hypothetical protein